MLKFNSLFFLSDRNSDTFESSILPTEEQKNHLFRCVIKIIEHLKPKISAATIEVLNMERSVTPRFRTQGSWSYDTCVIPDQIPHQQMDWDLGVYLPVTVWENNGPPFKMAKAYFDLVESLLKDICTQEKWELMNGKDTCIRIQISAWAHIDLPLYAAPENEFAKIKNLVALNAVFDKAVSSSNESFEFAESLDNHQQWDDLNSVVLATRTGEWKPSNPEAVSNWFKDRIEEHGPQLRRVCRYLKAWRDHHWSESGPTSVSIMIAVAQGFQPCRGRDDLVLEQVAQRLGSAFQHDIREPGIDNGDEDFNRLMRDERIDASQRFADLARQLNQALNSSLNDRQSILDKLRQQFGKRLPSDIMRFELASEAEFIRRTPASFIATPPVIPSTKAG